MSDQDKFSGPGQGQGGGLGGGGRGGAGKGRQGGNLAGAGAEGTCVCSQCGTTLPHQRGQPCVQIVCPRCGSAMLRSIAEGHGFCVFKRYVSKVSLRIAKE